MKTKKVLGVNEIQIEVKPFDDSIKEAAKIFRDISKGKSVKKVKRIVFKDIETLRKVITPERIRLMHLIKEDNPESIYELAKIAKRKWRAVANDIEILNNFGLVKLEKNKVPREIIRPLVSFSKMNIEVSI